MFVYDHGDVRFEEWFFECGWVSEEMGVVEYAEGCREWEAGELERDGECSGAGRSTCVFVVCRCW